MNLDTPRLWAAGLACVIGVLAGACSDSDGTTSAPPSSTTTSTVVESSSTTIGTTTTSLPATTTSVEAIDQLSVMSFNVRYDNPEDEPGWTTRLPAILSMLADRQPDVIGTQEALDHQVEDLAAGLDEYNWIGVGRDDGVAAGEYVAIFYRADHFELVNSGTRWLSETPELPSRGWDAALERIVTWVELRPVGTTGTFFVYNTHFDHEGVIARQRSAESIAELVAETSAAATFVVGDLNIFPTDPALAPLTSALDDLRGASPITDETRSFNAFTVPTGIWNIDYVLASGVEPNTFETITDSYGVTYISDHFPILATVGCDWCLGQ